jgi:glycerol-3-phosphate dehydrogenase
VHSQGHAYIFQNDDGRVVFVIPFEGRFSLIGTTDVPVASLEQGRVASGKEVEYLLRAVNRYLSRPLDLSDVVWSYAGVRPLYDDGSPNPSKVSRDYVTKVDAPDGAAPLLTIFGGKITTYRTLAEGVLRELGRFYPSMGPAWTGHAKLPGGELQHFNAFRDDMQRRHPHLGRELVEALTRRHGSRAPEVLGDAKRPEDLGRDFGACLTEREVEYLRANEWAATAEDILWRRTKCGIHMTQAQRDAFAAFIGGEGARAGAAGGH